MQGKLLFRNDDEKKRARNCGVTDFGKVYGLIDMAKGDVMFAATGVTDGSMVRGVRRHGKGAVTNSIVMRSSTGTVRVIEAQHNFERKAVYGHPGH
jgi:fructose-1,6-bisphosphatase II / sedoheptulose-1,7-bisphosphatase